MKKRINDIDGIKQRPTNRKIGDFKNPQKIGVNNNKRRTLNSSVNNPKANIRNNKSQDHIKSKMQDKSDQSGIDQKIEKTRSPIDKVRLKYSRRKANRKMRKISRRRKLAKKHPIVRSLYRFSRVAFLVVVLIGLGLGIKAFLEYQNIIERGGDGAIALQENIDPSQLKGEGDGRVNILLIGIGGDSHQAGNLADSIIVASIDPFAKEVGMLSIPRDMYVDVPGYWSTRINAAHAMGIDQNHPGGGIALMKETVESVLDIPIHYYVRVDFQGFVDAVNAVGGITINLDQPVYDPNFDWQYGQNALNLPAGEVHLNGTTALLLARARGASGVGIGVSRGDFGRGDRQRQMLIALKEKVLSLGTFSNPVKIYSLIETAGNHVKFDLSISDMLRLYEISQEIPNDKIISFGLDNGPDNYLASANIGGASVLVPKSGDYTEIQEFVRGLFTDGFIKSENASIDVLNGTQVVGLAGDTAAELETYGYNIANIGDAPTKNYSNTQIYDLSENSKPYTKSLLESRFGVTAKDGSELPANIVTTAELVIIIGDDKAQQDESGY